MRSIKHGICFVPLVLLSTQCGRVGIDEAEKKVFTEEDIMQLNASVLPIGLDLAPSDSIGYTINMEGCVSGLKSTATDTAPLLRAYIGDRGCIAKLSSLQFRNLTWTISTQQPFSTYKMGETAIFTANNDGVTQLLVTVGNQLSTPVVKTDTVGYSFIEKVAGSSGTVADFRINPNTTVLGRGSPAFILRQAQLTNITTTGAGQFSFTLECDQSITTEQRISFCHDAQLSQTTYILIKDPMDRQLSFAEVTALFASGIGVFSVKIPDDFVSPSPQYPNGGFVTKQGNAAILGPSSLQQSTNMILILANAGAFELFKITLSLY